ncbi:MAG TPA: hypothetical protein PKA20_20240 [Burkholderiaceae bacterium]|mgnify:CR=1 FL=1|nr:hypothetical protein [Burkholderiaceae bacterium]
MNHRVALLAAMLSLAAVDAVQAAGPTSFYWYDGQVRRELWLESSQVVDFAAKAANGAPLVKSSAVTAATGTSASAATPGGSKDPSSPQKNGGADAQRVSPMFRDTTSAAPTRALPGGVIVTLRQPLEPDEAREFLKQRGLVPVNQIGNSAMWVVESPAGLESLALANKLFESGEFAGAAPNWWRPRALK